MLANHKKSYLLLVIIVIVAISITIFFINRRSNQTKQTTQSTCTSKQFSLGSSGDCISDIQTMVDFIESDSLTQCPFPGAKALSINGSYDENTQTQVKVIQTWLNCYNKQEGSPVTINVDGSVGTTTWPELCTYAYLFPKQSNESTSPYFKPSLVAGKRAGC